ncbi:CatB-related O-acetyltransferase [Candidatus Odyssella acanthamoebae]|uniref:Chloramphenicol acetyltransferase n=1 Tax=Candidatus Odyssella acanthamoebae TaxID=91604 RepID=A0A077AYL1_9PROT|nr:CatB-related O-acetyltransferase [Candidatus Paracaedibacter acanthamoebae]AIK97084.1 chloramphenicol acetyltransferase [Candidatus Paracaedibacter acanthamoebae]
MPSQLYSNPNSLYPIEGMTRTCFLKNIITNPQIIVCDYTYYDDPVDIHNFERNVLYLFDFIQDKLIIGKFCQIAAGVRFIMNGSNHALDGISTYPFKIFGQIWGTASLKAVSKGDTIIGNDVWIGNSATIMPGITIGHGAIIGTNALVTKDVAPYTIVGGNPAQPLRQRFNDTAIEFLLDLQWWDWPMEKISDNIQSITTGNFEALRKAAR